MNEEQLIESIKYLVDKYLNDKNDLVELIIQDTDSVKFVLSEINKNKKREYEESDVDMLKDISFYYL
jgi:hypothetical protein